MWWTTRRRRPSRERRLDAELHDHLERHVADLVAHGLDEREARRQARLVFGGVEQVKEQCRDARGGRLFGDIGADLQFAWRLYRNSPVFTVVIVLSLAFGMGANTALFSLADALVLRPLPLPTPEQLIQVNRIGPGGAGPVISYPTYRALRDATSDVVELVATSRVWRWNIRSGAAPAERVAGELVTRNYFDTLRVPATVGRLFSSRDETSATATDRDVTVVVLSHAFWTRRFNADPRVVGAALTINGTAVTILGVAERHFTGVAIGDPVDMWAPLELQPRVLNGPNWLDQAGNNWLRAIGRLEPNATADRLREVAHAAFRRFLVTRGMQNEERIIVADGRHGLAGIRERMERPMTWLAWLVGIVLLTACLNVAMLHLGRATQRERELSVRLALGGSRARLVRQLLIENLLLSGLGAALGLLLAWASKDALLALLFPAAEHPPVDLALNGRLLLFTATLGIVTALISGFLPARLAWRLDLLAGLSQSGTRSTTSSSRYAGFVLPAAQVALTFVLLLGAALFARSLQALQTVEPGFDRAHVLIARMDVQSLPHTRPMFARLYRQLLDESSALPGARRVALADQALFTAAVRQRDISVEGFAPRPDADLNPYVLSVSPGFFDTMGIRFMAGRDFEEIDLSSSAAQVAIVNRSFARYYFDDAPAVGRRFGFGGQGAPHNVTIVGIVDDAKYKDLREDAPHLVYTALGPDNFPTRGFSVSETTLSIRTDGPPALLASALRRKLAAIDAGVPITGIATLQQHVDRSLGQDRLIATLSALFGALALGLTCTGIYGVLGYSVTRRTREIGVRLALGAQPAQIHWMIARRGLTVLALGLMVGVPAAAVAAQSINALLFNVTRLDVVSFGATLLVITIATLLASHGPARAAARVDPIDAIRRM